MFISLAVLCWFLLIPRSRKGETISNVESCCNNTLFRILSLNVYVEVESFTIRNVELGDSKRHEGTTNMKFVLPGCPAIYKLNKQTQMSSLH